MSNAVLREAMAFATPIGRLPHDFPYLQDLCREAFISYRDEPHQVKDKEGNVIEEYTMRDWFVVADPEPVKTKTGMSRSASGHIKFQMIVDYLEFRIWQYSQDHETPADWKIDRTNVLSVAIGKPIGLKMPDGSQLDMTTTVRSMKGKSWRDLNNELAKIGVRGYEPIKKPKDPLGDWPA